MTASARASQATSAPTRSRAAPRGRPRMRKQRTSPKFDGLKMWPPRHLITCFESSETAAVPAKIHQPRRLHQSPCCGPRHAQDERDAVAGEHRARGPQDHVLPPERDRDLEHGARPSEIRICAIESRKWKPICPSTCSDVITAARCRRGSLSFGRRTGYGRPRIVERPPAGGRWARGRSSANGRLSARTREWENARLSSNAPARS